MAIMMKKAFLYINCVIDQSVRRGGMIMKWFLCLLIIPALCADAFTAQQTSIKLPKPILKGKMTVEESLAARRSERTFTDKSVNIGEAAQLLWAAQGMNDSRGYRTAPSAGATFPLTAYLVAGKVAGLEAGIYRYVPQNHELIKVKTGDMRKELALSALGQWVVERAPASIIFCANYARTTGRYGKRGEMYAHMEAGHAGQNIYLQSAALGLATVAVGAFNEAAVAADISCSKDEIPVYIFPIGRRR